MLGLRFVIISLSLKSPGHPVSEFTALNTWTPPSQLLHPRIKLHLSQRVSSHEFLQPKSAIPLIPHIFLANRLLNLESQLVVVFGDFFSKIALRGFYVSVLKAETRRCESEVDVVSRKEVAGDLVGEVERKGI